MAGRSKQLSSKEKALLLFVYNQRKNVTVKEIAQELGVSYQRVQNLLISIRSKMRTSDLRKAASFARTGGQI